MNVQNFERALLEAEKLLERIHKRLKISDPTNPVRNRACEGFERARAELAKIRDDIPHSR
jgi:hypothetical protein